MVRPVMNKSVKTILVTAAGGLLVSATLNTISLATRVTVNESQISNNADVGKVVSGKLDKIIDNQSEIKSDLSAVKATTDGLDEDVGRMKDVMFKQ